MNDIKRHTLGPIDMIFGIIGLAGLVGGGAAFWGGWYQGYLVFFAAFGSITWYSSAAERVKDGRGIARIMAKDAVEYVGRVVAVLGPPVAITILVGWPFWMILLLLPAWFMIFFAGFTLVARLSDGRLSGSPLKVPEGDEEGGGPGMSG